MPEPPENPVVQILEVVIPSGRDMFSKVPENMKTELKSIKEFSLELLYHPGLHPMVSWLQRGPARPVHMTAPTPQPPQIAMISINRNRLKRPAEAEDTELEPLCPEPAEKPKRFHSSSSQEEQICQERMYKSLEGFYTGEDTEAQEQNRIKALQCTTDHFTQRRDDSVDAAMTTRYVTDQVVKTCNNDQYIKALQSFGLFKRNSYFQERYGEGPKASIPPKPKEEAPSTSVKCVSFKARDTEIEEEETTLLVPEPEPLRPATKHVSEDEIKVATAPETEEETQSLITHPWDKPVKLI